MNMPVSKTLIASLLGFSFLFIAPQPRALAQQDYGAQQGGGAGGSTMADPRTRAKLHTELGSLYFQDGNMAVALDELRIAIEADSDYASAYNVRGLVRMYLRETPEAEEDFKRALRLSEKDPDINNNYGWFLCQNGREKESIVYFLRALKNPLYQTPDRAYLNAGTCSLKGGDYAAAEDYFQKTLRFSRENPQATLQLASLYYNRNRVGEAKNLLASIAGKIELTPEFLWLALRIERKLGDRAAEVSYSNQLRRKFPSSTEYQELLKGNFE